MKELLAPVTEKSKCVSVFQTHLNQGVKKYHELVAAYPVSLLASVLTFFSGRFCSCDDEDTPGLYLPS